MFKKGDLLKDTYMTFSNVEVSIVKLFRKMTIDGDKKRI
ncbi:hypothetical protein NT98_5746 (plasmid) [Bacillus cereus]|nr:hypothetical protein NT98_5746 [Bacillus cereus]AJI08087.1 hypothetical protein AQ16_5422 [Bacillus cereus G9241]